MDADFMRIIEGRRYMYKGCKKRGVAIDGNISAYEHLILKRPWSACSWGYDKQRIDAGILLVNSKRSEKSPFGTTADLIKMQRLKPWSQPFNLPVSGLSDFNR